MTHFPDLKRLDQIDWDALRGISRPKVAELATCGFIEGADDVLIAGPIGTGKTHLAIALGLEAARRRYRVAFVRAADLVRSLLEARDERTLTRLHQRYQRTALLIVDELGFVPFDRAGGELLFNLLSDRYERRSTLVTTNLSFGASGSRYSAMRSSPRPCSTASAITPTFSPPRANPTECDADGLPNQRLPSLHSRSRRSPACNVTQQPGVAHF